MSAYVESSNKNNPTVLVEEANFTCKCGGVAVVKTRHFPNKWKVKNDQGVIGKNARLYYSHCLTCGEVTGWRFSIEQAQNDLLGGKVISGWFDKDNKFHTKDKGEVVVNLDNGFEDLGEHGSRRHRKGKGIVYKKS